MKKLTFLLFVLLAVETFGVYGAIRSDRISHRCTLRAGPLCYFWEENEIAKTLGAEDSAELDRALEKARTVWEVHFVERALEAKKSARLDKLMDDAKEAAERGMKKAEALFHSTEPSK